MPYPGLAYSNSIFNTKFNQLKKKIQELIYILKRECLLTLSLLSYYSFFNLTDSIPLLDSREGARNSRATKPKTGADERRGAGVEAGKRKRKPLPSLFSFFSSPQFRVRAPSRLSKKELLAVYSTTSLHFLSKTPCRALGGFICDLATFSFRLIKENLSL